MFRLHPLLLALPLLTLMGCATSNKIDHPALSKLQGIWEGEVISEDGSIKKWRQIRSLDGTLVTFFGYKSPNGEVKEFIENGQWWDEEARFHEVGAEKEAKPDIYTYEFYKTDCVRFVQTSKAGKEPGPTPYTFTECKVEEAPKVGHRAKQA